MGAYREQIVRYSWNQGKVSFRWAKKQMSRHLRRLTKRDPENSPTRRQTRGWV